MSAETTKLPEWNDGCVPVQWVEAFKAGLLSPEDGDRVVGHLMGCVPCGWRQDLSDENAPSSVVTTRLAAVRVPERTPQSDCIPVELLRLMRAWVLTEGEGDPLFRHLAKCPECEGRFIDLGTDPSSRAFFDRFFRKQNPGDV